MGCAKDLKGKQTMVLSKYYLSGLEAFHDCQQSHLKLLFDQLRQHPHLSLLNPHHIQQVPVKRIQKSEVNRPGTDTRFESKRTYACHTVLQ